MKIDLPTSMSLLLSGAVAVFACCATAQTWQTLDDFQYVAGGGAVPNAIAQDTFGNIYVAGPVNESLPPPSTPPHAVVQKSADGGSTWTISDDVWSGGTGLANYRGVAADLFGNVYAVGYDATSPSNVWFVRQSTSSGTNWNTVDTIGPGYSPSSVAADAAGNIYVAGYLSPSSGPATWIVRKGTNLGATWRTVDSYSPSGGHSGSGGEANGVFCHPTAGVFATGQSAAGKNGAMVWTTRRSLDGGATWQNVDTAISGGSGLGIGADSSGNVYVVGSSWTVRKSTNGGSSWSTVDSFGGTANSFAADSNGNLFVVGVGKLANGSSGWVVRENPGGTGAWTTIDTFQYASGYYAEARGAVADSAGNVYVAGYGNAPSNNHWLVRKN